MVAIRALSAHLVAVLKMPVALLPEVAQIKTIAILPDDVSGTCLSRQRVRPILNQLLQPAQERVPLATFCWATSDAFKQAHASTDGA